MGKKGRIKESPPCSHQLHSIHINNPITFYEDGIRELATARLKCGSKEGGSAYMDSVEAALEIEEGADKDDGEEEYQERALTTV